MKLQATSSLANLFSNGQMCYYYFSSLVITWIMFSITVYLRYVMYAYSLFLQNKLLKKYCHKVCFAIDKMVAGPHWFALSSNPLPHRQIVRILEHRTFTEVSVDPKAKIKKVLFHNRYVCMNYLPQTSEGFLYNFVQCPVGLWYIFARRCFEHLRLYVQVLLLDLWSCHSHYGLANSVYVCCIQTLLPSSTKLYVIIFIFMCCQHSPRIGTVSTTFVCEFPFLL